MFEFFRNAELDANSWANVAQGPITGSRRAKRKLQQNIFGGTFGGPIARENKLFFFTDYQGTFNARGHPIPSGRSRRRGALEIFPSLSAFIRDPQLPRTQLCQATPANPAAGVNYQQACFAGSQIPQTRIVNPVAQALFAER